MGYARYNYMGKECGYAVEGVCEEDGCDADIDRGMAYACGGEPGEHDDYCEGYFCQDHLFFTDSDFGSSSQRCKRCADDIPEVPVEWVTGDCPTDHWEPGMGPCVCGGRVHCATCRGTKTVEDYGADPTKHSIWPPDVPCPDCQPPEVAEHLGDRE